MPAWLLVGEQIGVGRRGGGGSSCAADCAGRHAHANASMHACTSVAALRRAHVLQRRLKSFTPAASSLPTPQCLADAPRGA
eukprot:59471-Chlamydomonas_euryale.AAC.2